MTELLASGDAAPTLALPAADGGVFDLERDASERAVLVMFMSNHCPYVKHVADVVGTRAAGWAGAGLVSVAINSNDPEYKPADAHDLMPAFAAAHGWRFPYLIDATQAVAKAYTAQCTPEFFLFDADHRLAYRGRLDASRPQSDVPVTGDELDAAVRAVLARTPAPSVQHPSIGCSIKWLPGNAPD